MYALLRAVAGVALRWFYRGIDVEGLERLPRDRPTLLAVNHPNALVDALVVGWVMPRRIVLTAKATLFKNPALAWLLRRVGVVPLVRAQDLRSGAIAGPVDASRNAAAFRALHDALRHGAAVLIFPEGLSHDQPSLAPLRTGAARIALEAHGPGGVRGLAIVPIGLTFECKEAPRTRVLAQVGEALLLDDWVSPPGEDGVAALTAAIDARLRAVTLNHASSDDAARATALASLFAGALSDPLPVGAVRPLRNDVTIVRRIELARRQLANTDDATLRRRVDALLHRADDLAHTLARHRIAVEDIDISWSRRDGARFLLRESALLVVGGPLALWGLVNHWLPFHAARAIARRSIESASDPAMRTIVAGAALVTAFYAAQAAVVLAFAGRLLALAYLASLPIAADINFLLRERLASAVGRARAYLLFRRRAVLRERLVDALRSIRRDAALVDAALRESERASGAMR